MNVVAQAPIHCADWRNFSVMLKTSVCSSNAPIIQHFIYAFCYQRDDGVHAHAYIALHHLNRIAYTRERVKLKSLTLL